jgi:hypothetical protein
LIVLRLGEADECLGAAAPPVELEANAPPAATVSEARATPSPLRSDQRRRRARRLAKRRPRERRWESSHGLGSDKSRLWGTARNSLVVSSRLRG